MPQYCLEHPKYPTLLITYSIGCGDPIALVYSTCINSKSLDHVVILLRWKCVEINTL